ncbi:hypothetical protein D910_12563 [Dendroctonus ponderosae]|uniref:pectinesterase n=2 Tax=Dendroctonus ponderosae TaxID=77166 RepID=U4UQC0_DENPD|nr:hypothetical protein D910_12563 [Dendroctonus ponderosae]
MKVVALFLLVVGCAIADQTPPGTSTRPILTSSEASNYQKSNYLQGWSPESISTSSADYTVGSGGYSTIQAAVNAAIKAGGSSRKHIKISAGTYSEVVYIPSTNVPLTLYGAGSSPSNTVISLSLSALISGSTYKNMVGGLFSSGDPAYSMFESCASKSAIGTSCSSVFWVKAASVQIVNLTIENSSKNTGTDQAVALQTNSDKVQIENSRLLGHQDTFYSGGGGTTTQRSHVTNTYIEGDVDFVFGGGTTVFEGCTFHAKADRNSEAVVFAPETDPSQTYGYLVVSSTITGDNAYADSRKVYFARSWDAGLSSANEYVAGSSPNGQVVIRESTINGVIPTKAPYTTATSGRTYSGNAGSSRNLNDALLLLAVAYASATQTSPGTSSRPILSSTEAASYTKAKYLQGWTPSTISTSTADYTVGSGYSTIQAAVNAAINAGGTTRKYIKIPAGTYSEVVYIPNTNVPLTIYGGGSAPANTVISLSLSATLTGTQYKSAVGSLFSSGDPAYSIYSSCASKSAIGTSCSTVFWVQAPGVQIVNLTIENSSKNSGTDQAVAVQTNADKVQIHNARLLGHQDTLCSGSGGTTVQRSHVSDCYIAGDVDFVFGGGSTVFEGCTFHAVAGRSTEAVVFAPDTAPSISYGYLVIDSTITGDTSFLTSKEVYLARSWDSGVSSSSDYVAGTSPNGQVVIRESTIDGVVSTTAPYTTATSGRAYSGNASSSRNLNNNSYNRFWEYGNSGDGA